jgi:UDPglucose 6-dehydrogenase
LVWEKDSRIGNQFLFPGIGYGGSCFPKDVKALNKTAQDFDYPFPLLKSVMKVNEDQKLVLFKKITNYFGDVKGKTFAIWGLAFKPNTDDIREASALTLIDALLESGANVKAYDPEAMENVKRNIGDKITYGKTAYDILQNADALIIATEWAEFKNPDLEKIKTMLSKPVVFDGRNIFSLKDMKQNGFYYESIGRPVVK